MANVGRGRHLHFRAFGTLPFKLERYFILMLGLGTIVEPGVRSDSRGLTVISMSRLRDITFLALSPVRIEDREGSKSLTKT